MMRDILASGTWKQCDFCRRKLPTRDHHERNIAKGFGVGAHWDDVIEKSGFCSYCDRLFTKRK